jgi:hypothetical protein
MTNLQSKIIKYAKAAKAKGINVNYENFYKWLPEKLAKRISMAAHGCVEVVNYCGQRDAYERTYTHVSPSTGNIVIRFYAAGKVIEAFFKNEELYSVERFDKGRYPFVPSIHVNINNVF